MIKTNKYLPDFDCIIISEDGYVSATLTTELLSNETKRTLAEAVKIALGKEPDYEKSVGCSVKKKERLNRTISRVCGGLPYLRMR